MFEFVQPNMYLQKVTKQLDPFKPVFHCFVLLHKYFKKKSNSKYIVLELYFIIPPDKGKSFRSLDIQDFFHWWLPFKPVDVPPHGAGLLNLVHP